MTAHEVAEVITIASSIGLIAWGTVALLRWLADDIARSNRATDELRALKMDLANWAGAGQFSDGSEYRKVQELAMKYAHERSW